jgi:hypothetical protein
MATVAAMHEQVHQRTGEDQQKGQGSEDMIGVSCQQ